MVKTNNHKNPVGGLCDCNISHYIIQRKTIPIQNKNTSNA